MSKLKFDLSLEEANLILGALSKLPFETVSGLITNIQAQAVPQLQKAAAPAEETTVEE